MCKSRAQKEGKTKVSKLGMYSLNPPRLFLRTPSQIQAL